MEVDSGIGKGAESTISGPVQGFIKSRSIETNNGVGPKIPKPTSFKVVSLARLNASTTVAELKLPSRSWNDALVRSSFLPEEASLILSIPCSSSSLNDYITLRVVITWGFLVILILARLCKVVVVNDVVPWAVAFQDEFRNANEAAASNSTSRNLVANSWRPPDRGHYKANSDAVLDLVNGKVGVGIVIRNFVGEVLASYAQPFPTVLSPALAEAIAIFRGFIFAGESGILPCTMESDAQVVVKLINDACIPLSDIGIIIKDIISFLDCHPGCKVVCAPRQANSVAHGLAKLGLSLDNALYWMEEASSCVAPFVLGNCPPQV
ncbi:hypothetical protein Q3G72_032892 [Acer saccharum]|nr:hypothetical protein Q3G72_032892 [Acer saccharum]